MDSALADPLVGRTLDGRYHVRSRIAQGGMATVYLASDTRLDRLVALKVMHAELARDADFVARFIGEAKSVAQLSHPNIVQVFDQGSDGHYLYLAMEYVPGRTLRSLLLERGWLSPGEALDIMIPVLEGLAAAHRAGIVHRDIKPENVLLTPDGRVKLADFGLARALTAAAQTRTGLLIGTVAYLAPEQVAAGITDTRTDVYAAGVMLFELLTGRQPHTGDTPMAVAYQHVNEDVPLPSVLVPGLPEAVDRLVAAATSRNPDNRPPDAGTFCRVLRAVRGANVTAPVPTGMLSTGMTQTGVVPTGHYAPAPRYSPREPFLQRWLFSRRIVLVLIALLLIAGAGGGAWWLTSGRYTTIPSVSGDTVAQARAALTGAGFKVATGTTVTSGAVGRGLVLTTQPSGQAARGSVITLVISGGPQLIAIPSVAGDSLTTAQQTLRRHGLTVNSQSQPVASTSAVGTVVGTNPAAGTQWPPGRPVTIEVAAGPPLPNFVGQNIHDLWQWAGKNHVHIIRRPVPSTSQPAGIVIAQSPAPNSLLTPGMSVTVQVSSGPHLVHVPNVDGMSIEKATARLERSGFGVKVIQLLPIDRIFNYSPNGMQPRGTLITIYAGA